MTFQPDQTETFLDIFRESMHHIRHFPGCLHLELLQDAQNPAIYCTYSHWTDADALENYRQSPLFSTTWARTKRLFADKPQAFSVYPVINANASKD